MMRPSMFTQCRIGLMHGSRQGAARCRAAAGPEAPAQGRAVPAGGQDRGRGVLLPPHQQARPGVLRPRACAPLQGAVDVPPAPARRAGDQLGAWQLRRSSWWQGGAFRVVLQGMSARSPTRRHACTAGRSCLGRSQVMLGVRFSAGVRQVGPWAAPATMA